MITVETGIVRFGGWYLIIFITIQFRPGSLFFFVQMKGVKPMGVVKFATPALGVTSNKRNRNFLSGQLVNQAST